MSMRMIFIAGFQYKWEAEKYYKLLKERMEKFGLELEESKSRIVEQNPGVRRRCPDRQ